MMFTNRFPFKVEEGYRASAGRLESLARLVSRWVPSSHVIDLVFLQQGARDILVELRGRTQQKAFRLPLVTV